jgi:hypothetical protein
MPRCTQTFKILPLVIVLIGLAAAATAQPPEVDPAAIKALDAMSAHLRTLKSFQVESSTTTDEVLEDGLAIQYSANVNFLVQMPSRLRVDVTSDRNDRRYVYDGKTFTLYARRIGYYATVPAPGTLRELDDVLSETYGIDLPLADLFRFGSPRWNADGIKAAKDLGPGAVDGTSCQHYAFRQDEVDYQIWIQKGEFPLPRKVVITTTSDASKPQYSATYRWNLAPSFNEEAFTFVAPGDAKKIVLAAASQQ